MAVRCLHWLEKGVRLRRSDSVDLVVGSQVVWLRDRSINQEHVVGNDNELSRLSYCYSPRSTSRCHNVAHLVQHIHWRLNYCSRRTKHQSSSICRWHSVLCKGPWRTQTSNQYYWGLVTKEWHLDELREVGHHSNQSRQKNSKVPCVGSLQHSSGYTVQVLRSPYRWLRRHETTEQLHQD